MKSYADACGVDPLPPRFELQRDMIDWARELIGEKKAFVLCTEGNWANRTWASQKYVEISKRLTQAGILVVNVGRRPDSTTAYGLSLCGKTTVAQAGAIIREAGRFFGTDSLLSHLAEAVGARSWVIYGSTLPKTRQHSERQTPIMVKGLDCLGCHNRWEGTPRLVTHCIQERVYCVENLDMETVWTALQGGFNESG